jgi:ferrochelatase
MPKAAVLLIAHGTVDELDELPEFLARIRRGHAAPEELVREVRRRYEAIGGRSPLKRTCEELAKKLEARLRVPVAMAMRLWRPYPRDVLAQLASRGIEKVAVVPLAQFSAKVYADAVRDAARELPIALSFADNWGSEPRLVRAFAREVRAAIADPADTTVVYTAHSLPQAIIDAGDPYERLFRESVALVHAEVGASIAHAIAFQSQGISAGPGGKPMPWLAPDLRSVLEDAARSSRRSVVLAPIGFLADHVETLYDLDIEAAGWARELGLTYRRSASLDASDPLVDALEAVARPLLEERP